MMGIPTESQLAQLPVRMLAAYAGRCAQWLRHIVVEDPALQMILDRVSMTAHNYSSDDSRPVQSSPDTGLRIESDPMNDHVRRAVTGISKAIEECGSAVSAYSMAQNHRAWYNFQSLVANEEAGLDPHHSIDAFAEARQARNDFRMEEERARTHAANAASMASSLTADITRYWPHLTPEIGRDYGHLSDLVQRRGGEDILGERIASSFFALLSSFDPVEPIIETLPLIDDRMIDYFSRHPDHLYSLNNEQFEDLVAKLLDGLGYEVERTARTRDGGIDVIAITAIPVRQKCLIECKRFARGKPVGVALVRQLLGVVESESANKGILATTGRFTKPAKKFLQLPSSVWRLEGRDLEGLIEWLELYQTFRMAKLISPY